MMPNWKQEIYAKQSFPQRVEMLTVLLQKNLLVDYSELVAAETDIENSPEYKTLLKIVTPRIASSQWAIASYLLY